MSHYLRRGTQKEKKERQGFSKPWVSQKCSLKCDRHILFVMSQNYSLFKCRGKCTNIEFSYLACLMSQVLYNVTRLHVYIGKKYMSYSFYSHKALFQVIKWRQIEWLVPMCCYLNLCKPGHIIYGYLLIRLFSLQIIRVLWNLFQKNDCRISNFSNMAK